MNAATNEVRVCVAKADKLGASIEERWSEHERDYDDAMARLHRSFVAQAVAVKQIKHMAGSCGADGIWPATASMRSWMSTCQS